jgi:hypothetical protein
MSLALMFAMGLAAVACGSPGYVVPTSYYSRTLDSSVIIVYADLGRQCDEVSRTQATESEDSVTITVWAVSKPCESLTGGQANVRIVLKAPLGERAVLNQEGVSLIER